MTTTRHVLLLAAAAPLVLVACTAEAPTDADTITVGASESACTVSRGEATTGASTFSVTNTGSTATEFYVYADADRVMGELENIGPGTTRDLIVELPEPGTYETVCKPGMVGDGLRTDFLVTGDAVRPSDTDSRLADATAGYQRYVVSQTEALTEQTAAFTDAVRAGDVAGAKALYPVARTYFERIEPVAESFGDLDPRIDVREVDLEEGQAFTGFHRLEKDLWVDGLQADSTAIADGLAADVASLAAEVTSPSYSLTPVQLANGAQGLLDEIAASKVTGEEDIYSHTDLHDFQANVDGARAAVSALAPVLADRDPALLAAVDGRFDALEATLATYRQGDGFVDYTTVTEPQRRELSDQVDAVAAQVSQVAGVVTGR